MYAGLGLDHAKKAREGINLTTDRPCSIRHQNEKSDS